MYPSGIMHAITDKTSAVISRAYVLWHHRCSHFQIGFCSIIARSIVEEKVKACIAETVNFGDYQVAGA